MSGEAFLSRWSRLKRTAVKPEPEAVEIAPPVEEAAALPIAVADELPADAALPDADGEADDPLKDLPPIEELTGESDFTPFLRAEVPEDLHRQALRKLWTSDPIYANDDGLKDYADDYASLFTGNVPVKTLYRVGEGFLNMLDEVAEGAGPAPVSNTDAELAVASDTPSPQPSIPSPPRGEG
ncbi:DUF3306 domain-containing protein [Azospirillum lipoferum]|uniref:DUF3306 domain-containing protein n=1 Tax=Azospirillum lipoferum (strain 4B) TaxID=862719 RepID=G7Z3K9_AZOL4|nr:DUF3306 domain-containing protein [Azospirillum lipoferum]CBS85998.1 Conserved protein of unknown function [Azospirillum lipoferum 4B]